MKLFKGAAITAMGIASASAANAAEILVTSDITTSTVWTNDNTYNLQDQIYVRNGATLTIEEGTVVASTTNLGGSLAVTRGSQLFVNGTQLNPVIMTSKADVATWDADPSHPTGGNPQTGTWREGCNEWGNLTIMGRGYISEDDVAQGNTAVPDPSNTAAMEGLVAAFAGDPDVQYGGGDDDDDSGSISYLNLRYGGRVIALNNELNGLSLGGLGRGTDLEYIEIMNNVDDGIEIWGGAVNLKHFSIWNIGDDSLDCDQGWRGKAQFGLIVQGYSCDDSQGSGVGDNAIETDGAENSDWQPVTTTDFRNLTVIGQPADGDGLTAWRDGARVQYHSSIFMDCGERVVRFDDVDGDGGLGYGHNGTLSWADVWTTSYTQRSTVNPFPTQQQEDDAYQAQSGGMLASMTDSVFYNNVKADAYTEAIARGVFAPANNNVQEPATSPIKSITRDAPILKGGKVIQFVSGLDPRANGDALTAVETAPNDGFFDQVSYRGAFGPTQNWLAGWATSDAYGFLNPTVQPDVGDGDVQLGDAVLYAEGDKLASGGTSSLCVTGAPSSTLGLLLVGTGYLQPGLVQYNQVSITTFPLIFDTVVAANPAGEFCLPVPGGLTGIFNDLFVNWIYADPGQTFGTGGTNTVVLRLQP